MNELLFVHGRAQEHKDAGALKGEWIAALREGLKKSDLDVPDLERRARFPYYGQTLYDLVQESPTVAEVIIRGAAADNAERTFQQAVIEEIQRVKGIPDEEVDAMLAPDVKARGPLNWEWVQAILKVIDRHVPGGSGVSIALATHDVYSYLRNPGVRDTIERGVRAALTPGVPTVVVSHSLGTVVAYNLLRREGKVQGWVVPLLITLGSPLAITAIKRAIAPLEHPQCAAAWFNAMDDRDVVALYPLDRRHFDVDPAIENHVKVRNHTANRHGIAGYLDDATVARRIHDALV